MGGKALKHLNVTRISDAEFCDRKFAFDLYASFMDIELPDVSLTYYVPGDVIKEDRGDLDVLFTSNNPQKVVEYFKKCFDSKGSVKNGNVNSIEWLGFQVDLICIGPDKLEFAKHYYSHGTCAALMGRLARYYNFKFGWDGLSFEIQVGTNKRQVLLNRDWFETCSLLGYDAPLDYTKNYSVEEVFTFLKSSKLLHKEVYRNSKPDRNYGFQEEFFEWIETQSVPQTGQKRVYGWYLLFKYYPRTAVKLTFEYLSMWKDWVVRPAKRAWRKVWFKHLMPWAFKLRGW